jgi:hypothetical protein
MGKSRAQPGDGADHEFCFGPSGASRHLPINGEELTGLATHGGKQKVQMQVTSSIETLLGLIGAPGADTEFSLPVSAKTVERWACDCSMTRVLMQNSSPFMGKSRAQPGDGADHEFCFGPSGAARHLPINGEELWSKPRSALFAAPLAGA